MRFCRKCGNKIPLKIKIDGKRRNIQNRKFCLICSPWGKHNTKKDIDAISSGKKYKDFTEKRKKGMQTNQYKRAIKRKEILINLKGGQCKMCGYTRALTFHHLNPEEKCFELALCDLWSHSWEKILEEAKKCILLCANCHSEIHSGNYIKNLSPDNDFQI